MNMMWFMTDREKEIAKWIDDNLPETDYTFGRIIFNRRSMMVYFGSNEDAMLFRLRWE